MTEDIMQFHNLKITMTQYILLPMMKARGISRAGGLVVGVEALMHIVAHALEGSGVCTPNLWTTDDTLWVGIGVAQASDEDCMNVLV